MMDLQSGMVGAGVGAGDGAGDGEGVGGTVGETDGDGVGRDPDRVVDRSAARARSVVPLEGPHRRDPAPGPLGSGHISHAGAAARYRSDWLLILAAVRFPLS